LNVSQNIIYDTFNKTRSNIKRDKKIDPEKVHVTSECLAIGHIIFNENNLELVKNELVFKDYLSTDLKEILKK